MTSNPRDTIPVEVDAVLTRLRRRIRRYVLLEGIALVLVVLGALFWLSLGIDALWFQLNRLELPRWFRATFLVVGASLVVGAFLSWIALRMFRRFRTKALALVLERRFPELDDRLITAVEVSDSTTGRESALTRAMLAQTVRRVADETRGLALGDVFERRPLRRAAIAALVLVATVGVFAVTNAHAMNRWWRAYFALDREYWERDYHLTIKTIAQPGDRVRDLPVGGAYRHPKGGAFAALIVVPDVTRRLEAFADEQQRLLDRTEELAGRMQEGGNGTPTDESLLRTLGIAQRNLAEKLEAQRAELRLPPAGLPDASAAAQALEKREWSGALDAQRNLAETLRNFSRTIEPWRIPKDVEFQYRLAGEGRDRPVTCTPLTDERLLHQYKALAVFRHSLSSLIDDMTFSVYGGDYTNREPYRVDVVDPPRIVEPILRCDFPAHTRPPASALDRRGPGISVRVNGSQLSLPMETAFVLEAECNKPLVGVRVEFGDRIIELETPRGDTSTATSPSSTEGRIIRTATDDRPREEIALSPAQATHWMAAGGTGFAIPFILTTGETEPARERSERDLFDFGRPIVLPPDSRLRIYLTDTDGILSPEPEQLTVNGTIDQPPGVEVKLRGIGQKVTSQAMIPIAGKITDDQGVAKAYFEFQVDDGADGRERYFRNPPSDAQPPEYILARAADEPFERFDVLPLELKVGQTLRLNVFASDADELNGPHVTRSERFQFEIISPEDLLGILYGRELNLRQRFEQIIKEVETVRDRIELQRDDRWPAVQKLMAENPEAEDRIAAILGGIGAAADQSRLDIDKNLNECRAIELGFRDILEELKNNRVYTVERIEGSIVQPLVAINDDDFPAADRAIGLFRLANERGEDPTASMNTSLDALDRMLEHMRAVLAEMQDLVEFHEAIRELKEIIDGVEKVRDETVEEQKRRLIERLGGPIGGESDDDEPDDEKP